MNQILENRIVEVEAVLMTADTSGSSTLELPERTPLYELTATDFQRIAGTETPQGIAAVCRIPSEASLDQLAGTGGLVVAMDAVQDPGNVGTMLRTAAWFDTSAVICGRGTVDPWHPKVVRSTAGATGVLPILSGELEPLLQKLESLDWEVQLLDAGPGAVELKRVPKRDRVVLVVGNEGRGVAREHLMPGRPVVKIEGQSGHVESLNAAVALSIALYERKR